MFCRKQSRKKCHPCITLAIITAGALGAIGLMKKGMQKGKCMLKTKMKNLASFIKGGCKYDQSNG